jgi:hypothetical protein
MPFIAERKRSASAPGVTLGESLFCKTKNKRTIYVEQINHDNHLDKRKKVIVG